MFFLGPREGKEVRKKKMRRKMDGWPKGETKKKGDKTERQTTALIRFGTGGKAEPERESEWAGECARGVTLS